MADLKGKHYIETQDLSLDELNCLLSTSDELKDKFHRGEPTLLNLPPNSVSAVLRQVNSDTQCFRGRNDPTRVDMRISWTPM